MKELYKEIGGMLTARQKRNFIFITAIMLVSAGAGQLVPLCVGRLTDELLGAQHFSLAGILPFLVFLLAVSVANELLKVARRLMVEDTCTRFEKTARTRAVASLLKAPLSYFRENMTGNIHGMLNRSLEGAVKLLKLLFMDLAPAVFSGAAAVAVLFSQLPSGLALAAVLVVPIGIGLVWRQVSTQKGIRVQLLQEKAGMDGMLVELLGGIEVIRVCDTAGQEVLRFDGASEQLRRREMKHHRAMAGYDCLKFVNEAVFTVVVIGAAAYLAGQHVISVGMVLTAYLCFTQLTAPLRELHRILDELAEAALLCREYFRLAKLPPDFSYLPEGGAAGPGSGAAGLRRETAPARWAAGPQEPARGQKEEPTSRPGAAGGETGADLAEGKSTGPVKEPGEARQGPAGTGRSGVQCAPDISLSDVVFRYGGQEVLRGVTLEVPHGTYLGIAGKSGCGKSTLVRLICKLEAARGVCLGGVPIQALSRADIAGEVSLVPQSPFLVAGTVRENICYGTKRAVTDEEVREAARRADIADFIEAQPQGYGARVAEGGRNLSGGQKQRIALARVFLQRPRVLILDEATSALDNVSEKKIQAELEKLHAETGMTVIAIAHRLTTLQNCDAILVMEDGRVVQKGTFRGLSAAPGAFRRLCRSAEA